MVLSLWSCFLPLGGPHWGPQGGRHGIASRGLKLAHLVQKLQRQWAIALGIEGTLQGPQTRVRTLQASCDHQGVNYGR